MQFWKKWISATVCGALCMGLIPAASAAADTAMETEPNNTIETATAISCNDTVSGALAENSDVDYYTITTDEPGTLSITFSHEALEEPNTFWNGTLIHEDGAELYTINSTGDQTSVSSAPIGLAAGTYYIRIRPAVFQYHDATYTLTTSFTPQQNAEQLYEQEMANDTAAQALTLEIGQDVTGNIYTFNDKDYYRITLDQTSDVSLIFRHALQDTSSSCWNVVVYNADESRRYTWSIPGNGETAETSAITLDAGTYYLCVTNGTRQTIDSYTMCVQASAVETVIPGDLDGDGKITIQDAFQTLIAYANASAGIDDGLTNAQRTAADVDSDGKITIQDAFKILIYYATESAGRTPSWD